jgi:hypothetical protein
MVTNSIARMAAGMFVCLLLPCATALAQNTGITGQVKDTSGGILPGVTVEASSPALIEKVRSVVTNADGLYQIVDLRPGVYSVTFTLPGFQTLKREGVELTTSFTATVNAELGVGSVTETITVKGESPIVDVNNVVQQKVLDDQLREALPTARSYQTMAAVIPGVGQTGNSRPHGQDVGGSTGERGLLNIHGGRLSDMTAQFDGVVLNVAFSAEGTQNFTVNPVEAQEYVYELGAIAADTQTGGVRVNVVPKEGGNRVTGYFLQGYSNDRLQSNNLTQELIASGLPVPNKIELIYDTTAAVGGPIRRDKLWFYTSYRKTGSREGVAGLFRPVDPLSFTYVPDPNQPAKFEQNIRNYGVRLTWQATPKNNVGFYAGHNPRTVQPRTVSATTAYEAAQSQEVKLDRMIVVKWKAPVTDRLLIDATYGSPHAVTPNAPSMDYLLTRDDIISITDTGLGFTYRSAATYATPVFVTDTTKASLNYVTGSHALKVGVDHDWGYQSNRDSYSFQGISYTFRNRSPLILTQRVSPFTSMMQFSSWAAYAQDQWKFSRATINAGLRFDYQHSWIPVQTSGPGPLVPLQTWPAVDDIPNWQDLSPRLGVSYDLFGNGKTAVKGTLSRYVLRDSLGFSSGRNPMLFNQSTTRSWTDNDRDFFPDCVLTNLALNGECGAVMNQAWGTTQTTSHTDDAIRIGFGIRPANWELSAGVQHELLPRVAINVTYTRRWYDNFTLTDNLAVTPTDFTQYCITAPTDARLPNSGQSVCGLYDLNPNKLGQVDNFVTSAKSFGVQREWYNGVDMTFQARLRRGQLGGGVSAGTGRFSGNGFTNSTDACFVVDSPGALRFCERMYPWTAQLRLLATYELPWGVDLGATFQNNPGPEILASFSVTNAQVQGLGRNLSSGSATVPLIQPGTMFGSRVTQLDLRVSKTVEYRRLRARLMLDIANLLNASTVLVQNTTYGSNWLQPTFVMPGRLFRPTIQIDF